MLLSRTDLDLPIDRWRGQGRLIEVRFPELRFSFGEACDMLTRLVPDLAEDDVKDVPRRSDGWAAGVQLSALAARARSPSPMCAPRASNRTP